MMHKSRWRLYSFVTWISFLLVLLVVPQCASLASLMPFSSYQFAPNGVCISPTSFKDTKTGQQFMLRNVPGDGDCMFLAVALAALTSLGLGANDVLLKAISRETRDIVATILEAQGNLVIEGQRLIDTKGLLKSAAKQEELSEEKYMELLRRAGMEGGLYGGGPELTVLANVLRRPITIYELDHHHMIMSTNSTEEQPVKQMGTFGEQTFQDPLLTIPNSAILSSIQPGAYSWHLHILVVDVSNKEKHACVLLPQ